MTGPALETFDPAEYRSVVFFAGAGLSAESGVPIYRGHGGIWAQCNYEDYACQRAFDRDPVQVLEFPEVRRTHALQCPPHAGHRHLAALQAAFPYTQVVTLNIDGVLQRAGIRVDAELHGSLWRQRCPSHGLRDDRDAGPYRHRRCPDCGAWLRPDTSWFEDKVDEAVFDTSRRLVAGCELFVSVGTSGIVWPAAGSPSWRGTAGALMVEVNPEDSEASPLYRHRLRWAAGRIIPGRFRLAG